MYCSKCQRTMETKGDLCWCVYCGYNYSLTNPILNVYSVTTVVVETVGKTYHRISATEWEEMTGESWEAVRHPETLEKHYREYLTF